MVAGQVSTFSDAFAELVGVEGKYSDDPKDPGNWTGGAEDSGELKGTKYGISAKAYPSLDIVNLSLTSAQAIYLRDFWAKLRCDTLPPEVAKVLFKQGVNMGVDEAAKAFQRSLKTEPDGVIGQMTIGLATNEPTKIVLDNFLTECAYAYTTFENFKVYGRGWLSRIIVAALETKLA